MKKWMMCALVANLVGLSGTIYGVQSSETALYKEVKIYTTTDRISIIPEGLFF